MMPPSPDQPTMTPPAAPAEQGASGYTIKIVVAADQTMSVGVEPGGEPAGNPVDGLKGAVSAVIGIIENDGNANADAEGSDDFSEGFGGEQLDDPMRKFG